MYKKLFTSGLIIFSSIAIGKPQSELIECAVIEGLHQRVVAARFFKTHSYYYEINNQKLNNEGDVTAYTLMAYSEECKDFKKYLNSKSNGKEKNCETEESKDEIKKLIDSGKEIDEYLLIGPDTYSRALKFFNQSDIYTNLNNNEKKDKGANKIYLSGVNSKFVEEAGILTNTPYLHGITSSSTDDSVITQRYEDLKKAFPDLEIGQLKISQSTWPDNNSIPAKRFIFTYKRKIFSTTQPSKPTNPSVVTSRSKVPDGVKLFFKEDEKRYYCRIFCNGADGSRTCSVPLNEKEEGKADKECNIKLHENLCIKKENQEDFKC